MLKKLFDRFSKHSAADEKADEAQADSQRRGSTPSVATLPPPAYESTVSTVVPDDNKIIKYTTVTAKYGNADFTFDTRVITIKNDDFSFVFDMFVERKSLKLTDVLTISKSAKPKIEGTYMEFNLKPCYSYYFCIHFADGAETVDDLKITHAFIKETNSRDVGKWYSDQDYKYALIWHGHVAVHHCRIACTHRYEREVEAMKDWVNIYPWYDLEKKKAESVRQAQATERTLKLLCQDK